MFAGDSENKAVPLTIYLRDGVHYFKSREPYITINRGNLYITAYPGETVTIRPYYWPGNPADWGDELAIEFHGSFQNLVLDGLRFEGWSLIVYGGSEIDTPAISKLVIKNCSAGNFTRRNGEPDWTTSFLETCLVAADVYGEGKQIFDNPDTAHYQIKGLILSNISVSDVDIAVNIGDENDANVRGLRITNFTVNNTEAHPGASFRDAFAVVNSSRVLIDHCKLLNIDDDGVDTKSFDVAVVNCFIQGTGRNAVKFWRNGEMINTILYDVTDINDGAIISEEGPFRMVNSVLLRHPVGYAGTIAADNPTTQPLRIVNCVFGEVRDFWVRTTDFGALNNRFFDILDDSPLVSGHFFAQDDIQLNALPHCDGNATSTNQFINPDGGDFSVPPASEWIDAGTSATSPMPDFDYFGNPRVSGDAIDIGPIEYQKVSPQAASGWMLH